MKDKKLLEKKLNSALYALASGVLTSIFYDALSESSYVIEDVDKRLMLIPIQALSFVEKFSIFAALFLILWVAIWFMAVLVQWGFDRVRCHRRKIPTRADILSDFRSVRNKLLEVSRFVKSGDSVIFYAEEIATCILTLHRDFYPPTEKMRSHVQSMFRKNGKTSSIGIYLSPYEYTATIGLAKDLLENLSQYSTDDLLQKDCSDLKERIIKLLTVPGPVCER